MNPGHDLLLPRLYLLGSHAMNSEIVKYYNACSYVELYLDYSCYNKFFNNHTTIKL